MAYDLYLNTGITGINVKFIGIIILFLICKYVWVLLLYMSYKQKVPIPSFMFAYI